MIDPIIFSFDIGGFRLALHWYGVLIMLGVMVGAWVAEREIKRRGADSDWIWDALLWIIPAGIAGARLWYVLNDIAGGDTYYLENPLAIFNTMEGGLHIFGAVVFGLLAAYLFARRRGLDILLALDAAAPALLIGQALARPANFINQELYGPPTDLPWGIPISPERRMAPWNDLGRYPDDTRFHPTFAYEMIWNLLAAALLLWAARRYEKQLKPGMLFAGWLVLAGTGRFIIEFFRPDQPRLPGTDLSYSRLISALMAVAGLLWFAARAGWVRLPFFSQGPDHYQIKPATASVSKAPAIEARSQAQKKLVLKKKKSRKAQKAADDNGQPDADASATIDDEPDATPGASTDGASPAA